MLCLQCFLSTLDAQDLRKQLFAERSWNNFMWPFIITNNPDLMTLPVGLSTVKNAYGTIYTRWTV